MIQGWKWSSLPAGIKDIVIKGMCSVSKVSGGKLSSRDNVLPRVAHITREDWVRMSNGKENFGSKILQVKQPRCREAFRALGVPDSLSMKTLFHLVFSLRLFHSLMLTGFLDMTEMLLLNVKGYI